MILRSMVRAAGLVASIISHKKYYAYPMLLAEYSDRIDVVNHIMGPRQLSYRGILVVIGRNTKVIFSEA